MFRYGFFQITAAITLIISLCMCSGCSAVPADSFTDSMQDVSSAFVDMQTEEIQKGNEQSGFAAGYSHVDFSELDTSLLLASEREGSLLGQPGYCYGTLSEEEQVVYEEIYAVLAGLRESCILSTTDSELVRKVYDHVAADHPEVFWADGYRLNTTSRGDEVISLEFSMKKTMEQQEIANWQMIIYDYLQRFLQEAGSAGLGPDSEDYDIIRFTFDYIVKHTEYREAVDNNQNICSVFGSGYSVCQGYSVAMQYLLLYQGVKSVTVPGVTRETQTSHAWNLVYADDSWYYLDVTWGDPSFTESSEISDDMVNYSYFCVTGEEISKTHIVGEELVLPECTDTEDNYFVHENCYFESWDEAQFENLLSLRMESGDKYLSIRFHNDELYQQTRRLLIDEQKIFTYMEDTASQMGEDTVSRVSYFENRDFYIITFMWE